MPPLKTSVDAAAHHLSNPFNSEKGAKRALTERHGLSSRDANSAISAAKKAPDAAFGAHGAFVAHKDAGTDVHRRTLADHERAATPDGSVDHGPHG